MKIYKFTKTGSSGKVETTFIDLEDLETEDLYSECEEWARQDLSFQNNGYSLACEEIVDNDKKKEALEGHIETCNKIINRTTNKLSIFISELGKLK